MKIKNKLRLLILNFLRLNNETQMTIDVYSKHGPEFIPVSSKEESAGYDLICPYDVTLDINNPTHFLDLGIVLDGPERTPQGKRWAYQMIPRSSSSKLHLKFVNTIGLVDSDYRGPKDTLKVSLEFALPKMSPVALNANSSLIGSSVNRSGIYPKIELKKGDKIGQIVFFEILKPRLWAEGALEDHPGTESRGGHGSTGK